MGMADRQAERIGRVLAGQARQAEEPHHHVLDLFLLRVAGGLEVNEYTALQMKKAIVGHGQARKEQVQAMVVRLLGLPGLPGKDAADALGLAICHAHAGPALAALGQATTLERRSHAHYRKGRLY